MLYDVDIEGCVLNRDKKVAAPAEHRWGRLTEVWFTQKLDDSRQPMNLYRLQTASRLRELLDRVARLAEKIHLVYNSKLVCVAL